MRCRKNLGYPRFFLRDIINYKNTLKNSLNDVGYKKV